MNFTFQTPAWIRQSHPVIIAVAMSLLLLPLILAGQTTRDSDHKADHNMKSLARVNPATLAMEFSIPLAGYPGRSGNSQSVSFNYSSKVWTIRQTDFRGRLISGEGTQARPWEYTFITSVTPLFGERTLAGWTSSLGPVSIVPEIESFTADGSDMHRPQNETACTLIEELWINNDPACPFGRHIMVHRCVPEQDGAEPLEVTYNTCYTGPQTPSGPEPTPSPFPVPDYKVKRIRLQLPDGSTREFRKDDKVYDCNVESCMADEGTYLSVDGTGLRLVVGTSANPFGQSTLFMPDGSRYEFPTAYYDDEPQHFVDKYGNRSDYNPLTRSWTDTAGRSITDPLPTEITGPTPGPTFQLPSVNGQSAQYAQDWKLLKPEDCVNGDEPSCAESALENPADALYSLGNDTCENRNVDHPTPASRLFIADPTYTEQVITQSNPQRWYENTYKFRICGVLFNPVVLHSLTLPNGTKYRFKYNRYGEITEIIYPTGAYERFQYDQVPPLTSLDGPYDQANRGVIKRWVSEDGVSEAQEWNYEANFNTAGLRNVITAPDGSRTETEYSGAMSLFGFENPLTGKILDERVYSKPSIWGNPASAELLKRTINEYVVAPPRPGGVSQGVRDARTKRSVTFIFEPGSTKALATLSVTEYDETGSADPEFFSHLNVKRQKGYHFVQVDRSVAEDNALSWPTIESWFTADKLASIADTDYLYDANYKSVGILGLPRESRVMNPADPDGPPLARTETVYDNQLPAASTNYPGSYIVENYGIGIELNCGDPQTPKICWQNPQNSRFGRPTTSRVWNAESGTWIETHTRYDIFGNAIAGRDPVGNETTTEFSAAYKYAFPTKVSAPAPDPTNTTGTDQTSTIETTYDLSTGLPLTVKDDFGQITRTEYDGMLRPVRVFGENFAAPESQTIYGVPDANGQLPPEQRFVKVRKQIDASNWDDATTWFDGLGRTVKTQAKDSQGDVFVESKYDSMGRVERVTNPYRLGDTVYWSKTRYDAMGRAVESYAPAELANLANAQSLGVTSFDISTVPNFIGTVVTTTDASGRKGRSITNALGQLIRVDEPTGVSTNAETDLGTLAAPNQPTSYKYDAYGKMVEVTQGEQKRWFKYDSLGRLLRVRQPEQEVNTALNLADPYNTSGQWTAGFSYDILGNVLTATDANGTTITNTYDRANRVKTRTYSNEPAGISTPAVSFFYDGKGLNAPQSPNYAKGKLTKVSSSVSATEYQLFDNFGRLTQSSQITDGQTYTSGYQYNLSGALVQETYPSGRVVKNEFEPDGDLMRIFGKATPSATERSYANSFSYTPDGRIERLKLGNGLWERAAFNSRLQVTELNLGWGLNGDLWKLGYQYGEIDANGNVDSAKNTGNVARQTLNFSGLTNPFVQSYKYDSLYRITEAKETANGQQTWIQNWNYDRYGNRTFFSQNIGGQQMAVNNLTFPTIDPASNRFQTNPDQGYDYDKNGNLTEDPTNAGRTFVFNGDNKQTEVRDATGVPIGQYFYDGEGRRVKKVAGSETTVFVYSNGKLIAEYSTATPPQNPTTNWTVTDQLGSPRVLVNSMGDVVSRRDFMPFGEELYADTQNRTVARKYSLTGQDSVRKRFTGYEKDAETGLDFAEARYYNNQHARFTAVDPLLASGKSADPQTFNRYVYVLNNPLVLIDPDGLQVATATGKVYQRGREYAIFRGRPAGGYTPVKRTIHGTTTINGAQHHFTVRPGGWVVGDRVDGATFTAASPAAARTRSDLSALGVAVTQNVKSEITGILKGIPNAPSVLLNSLTGGATQQSFLGNFIFGGSNPFEVPLVFSYNDAREASAGSASSFGTLAGAGAATGTIFGGSSTLSVVPEVTSVSSRSASSTAFAETGSYLHRFESGKFYAGKGAETRMRQTGNFYSKTYDDPLVSSEHFRATSNRAAFMDEHKIMMENGGPLSVNPASPTYNKILSPGCKFFCP